MIQAIGLTSVPRRNRPPAVDDLTFEALPGRITVLLGESGAGKTSALRLMLRLDPGRGIALFRGRSLDRVAHPVREVGVLLGDVPGHPARTARGHLRMLGAAAGVPPDRADEVLDVVGLGGLADQRIGDFSHGMDRRLGLAAALLGDPHTLVLDEPAAGLSPRETSWLHGLLRGYADQGGAVLLTSSSPGEAARLGDQVVTIHRGRLVADQEASVFARARLRPKVAVQSPSAARLAHVIAAESDTADPSPDTPPVEVVHDGGSTLSVYGRSCAAVGETAHRHGILVHRLTEETDTAPLPLPQRVDGHVADGDPGSDPAEERRTQQGPLARVQPPLPAPGPVWPLRYELRRTAGVRTGWIVAASSLLLSLVASVLLARAGAPVLSLLAGWPAPLPLPPAALGAGVLGALAFGQEFRYPALAPDVGSVPRRLALLGGKLVVTAAAALLLAFSSVALGAGAVRLLFGGTVTVLPAAWGTALVGWAALTLGCAWAGLLAAGLFRSTVLGLMAVLVVPALVVPVVSAVLARPAARSLAGLPERLRSTALLQWPAGLDEGLSTALRVIAQPVGWALILSLTGLLAAYVLTLLRGRPR
ncbi:ATP-binding cassette domain-containing protein [Streptomyces sp. AV19]|uniref:ABC transporter ATP-binding protein n=1 Tax=Streptomyces sp. AV19 TaxID=2793068 RepID=UPI0018FE1D28|nr:ATP-binding cassette domain-containing protein [Streptomyces sp. AV19]MBH1938642.1 ATP-binding cassette domain-containing protein [Streptomyces sp. AV19]MDG4535354.1 ATP-binding cassette domain-containing protein [Streptomyces sp. AV19]